jgi:hypothetical protein
MVNKDKIKAFAQHTLGCGCPEEVFQHIECESNIRRDGVHIAYKIIIGNRLLIYIFTVDTPDSLKDLLPRLVDIGKRERDSSGFNRFRLVLAEDDVDDIRQKGEQLFNALTRDEKIYLHILPKTSIPKFCDA